MADKKQKESISRRQKMKRKERKQSQNVNNVECGISEASVPVTESATTSRAGGMRMAPGRGRDHLCWGPLIFKKNFLISVLSDLSVLMTT